MIFQIINFIYYTSVNSEVADVQPHWWLDWKCGHETLYSNDINQSYYIKQIINHIVSKLGKWYMFLYIYIYLPWLWEFILSNSSPSHFLISSPLCTEQQQTAVVVAPTWKYCCVTTATIHTKLNTLRSRRRYYNWKYSNTRNNTYPM